MLLYFSDDEPFATGAQLYSYHPITDRDLSPRLMLRVDIKGVLTSAAVDTGAPYLICAPAVARYLTLDPAMSLGRVRLLIRSVLISGWLHHLRLIFPAVRGNDLLLDATAFVPDAGYAEVWGTLPSFLGMQGCLDRLRFAVDPVTDTFYFGPLSWE